MNIGVIGAGKIGGTAARLFVTAGHQVTISNSRGPASLAALREALGPKARAGTVAEAAAFGDLVLVAIPFGQFRALPATPLAGKVVVDAMNYYPQRDGRIEFGDLTSSELVAQSLSGARLVKAFNTMYFETLAAKGRTDAPMEDRLALLVAGDDAAAKAAVSRLVEEIGFAQIDTGSLRDGGRLQQPGSTIFNRPMSAREAQRTLRGLR
jgi:predicted dinucleotide-binding enzyme